MGAVGIVWDGGLVGGAGPVGIVWDGWLVGGVGAEGSFVWGGWESVLHLVEETSHASLAGTGTLPDLARAERRGRSMTTRRAEGYLEGLALEIRLEMALIPRRES